MYYYLTIVVGLMIIFTVAGFDLPVSGGIAQSLNIIDDGGNSTVENVKDSSFWGSTAGTSLKYILTIAIGASLVIGAFGRTPDPRYITGGFVFALAGAAIADFTAIIIQLNSYGIVWLSWLGTFILGSLIVGLIVTTLEFWNGSD